MEKLKQEFEYELYSSAEELNDADRNLLLKAVAASANAYAPYSKFNVGAAVLLENGEVITGSNQENASYPSGLCAERVALFTAGSNFPGIKVNAIAITAHFKDSKELLSVTPCGDCRQVMAEYESRFGKDIRMIMTAADGKVLVISGVATLLPFMFSSTSINSNG